MARCNFCRQNFRSAQAVRAHLRWCDAYTGSEPEEESLIGGDAYKEGEPKAQPRGFDPVHHVRQQVQTEEQRLRLRQLQSAHHELDEKERRKAEHPQREAEAARRRAEEETLAQIRALEEDRERERRERQEKEERRRRREIIQRVKQRVMTWGSELRWSFSGLKMTSEIKAKILVEIERELSSLPADELAENELVTIAEGVVDRFYQAALKAKEEKEAQERAAWREGLRASEEAENQKRRRSQLISHAESYAGKQLEDLSPLDRMEIVGQVRYAVAEEINGSETRTEVEDLTDEILDGLLPENDQNDGEEED